MARPGSPQLHILDKFSISLNCERRIVDSEDANLPNVVVSGTLPKLIVHINEDKVHTLQRMAQLLIGDIASAAQSSGGRQTDQTCQTEPEHVIGGFADPAESEGESTFFPASGGGGSELDGSAKLLLLYFCVNDMAGLATIAHFLFFLSAMPLGQISDPSLERILLSFVPTQQLPCSRPLKGFLS